MYDGGVSVHSKMSRTQMCGTFILGLAKTPGLPQVGTVTLEKASGWDSVYAHCCA